MIAAIFALRFTMYVAWPFAVISALAFIAHLRDSIRAVTGSKEWVVETKGARESLLVVIIATAWILACRSVLPLVTP